jgi:hypothetical protein
MKMRRRAFLSHAAAATVAAGQFRASGSPNPAAIDFRYRPGQWQTAYCFPDDPFKSLIGDKAELLYGHPGRRHFEYFPTVVTFSLAGMEADVVTRQELESPGVPIVHTRIERSDAFLELTTFATNRPGEGRVDNVRGVIRPRSGRHVAARPLVSVRTKETLTTRAAGGLHLVFAGSQLLMAVNRELTHRDTGTGCVLSLAAGDATPGHPLEFWIRFPQERQPEAAISAAFTNPEALLTEARAWWRGWRAFGGDIGWKLPGVYQNFLTACARNIQQAREVRDGMLTFQVGPTVYRGLWVVDGHFILEAARYLGFEAEANRGLDATWAHQEQSGMVQAGGGKEHWKDAAIPMFTLVRQCELTQKWEAFDRFRPHVQRSLKFLGELRDRARKEEGPLGRYGLLARGIADGGLRHGQEVTNTLWTLASLKAISAAARDRNISGFEQAAQLYSELRRGFDSAARQEMRRHADGFEFLPMLLKEDPLWDAEDARQRPRPQVAQWALSHVIYPGLLFAPDDPVVKGHIALMQACTREDVPIETGWIPAGGLWTYNAAFVSQVYLWAGLQDWARLTFHGFLNHASPLYCWREEQPLQNSLEAGYVGDMPHNWASAECIRYLRHMLALEDGSALRLLDGIGDPELALNEPFLMERSPTRFGRVSLALEASGRNGWRLSFERMSGQPPAVVRLPARLGSHFVLKEVTGADSKRDGSWVRVSPHTQSWSAVWTH